jgi:AcrR family transcriptional regulator
MAESVPKEKGTPMPAIREPLTKERILAAAIALVDREGLEALSMRRLGRELGVQGMSLYNHIPSKSALLFDLINSMFAEIPLADVDDVLWKDQMRSIMHSFRDVGLAHPNIFLLYASRSWDAVRVNRRDADHLLMRRAGFSEARAGYAMRVLTSFVLGFVAREVERLSPDRDAADEGATLDGSASTAPYWAPDQMAEAFDFGLDVILSGLEGRLAAT